MGVMELAGRVIDVVTNQDNFSDCLRELLDELKGPEKPSHWRMVLRIAALCHDLGRQPLSHAAERHLLPAGWNHERLTRGIIESDEMQETWNKLTPPLRSDDIVILAVGKRHANDLEFSDWQAILSEIIAGDAFGGDRIDCRLRDSHHAGVGFGKLNHHWLIDTGSWSAARARSIRQAGNEAFRSLPQRDCVPPQAGLSAVEFPRPPSRAPW